MAGHILTAATSPPKLCNIPTYQEAVTHSLMHKKCGYDSSFNKDLYR